MFVENYRLDTLVGGQAQTGIPYAKISDDDWHAWKAFLPPSSGLSFSRLWLQIALNPRSLYP
jgi:hypothetical protein